MARDTSKGSIKAIAQEVSSPVDTDQRSKRVEPFSVVDLFAGAGGLSVGFHQAGFEVLAGSDIDPDALATYAGNLPKAESIHGDIRKPDVKERVFHWAAKADVIVGGPPCQAFSQVRNHTRIIDDPRNSLYKEFVDVIRTTRPKAFLVENVTGMDQMGVREQIRQDLTVDGAYRVKSQVVDAADFGVPQTRKRLLFIGVREDLDVHPPDVRGSFAIGAVELCRLPLRRGWKYELRTCGELVFGGLAKSLQDPEDLTLVSAEQALSDLEMVRADNRNEVLDYAAIGPARTAYQRLMREGAGESIVNVSVPRINDDTMLRLQAIPPGGNYRDLPEDLTARYITGQKWGQSNGTGQLSRKHFYAYRKLHPSIWAWTLNTKADSVYHYKFPRALTVREFARLQSFPDWFVVRTDVRKGMIEGRYDGGAAHSRYRQIGNAVPPLLAEAVARALAEALNTAKTSPRHSTIEILAA
ncbi:MAG: DNA cytosine methyltransferase [Burkholderiales bacterium]|nr:DNA cytosine methyltransferase [Burkholderiales bacterium]